MKTEIIRTEDAVGQIIAHDIARIVQGEFKGNLFRKGHKIDAGDVEKLLDVGKYNIYVLTLEEDDVHEDQAGIRLGEAIHGTHTYVKPPSQSRVNIFSDCRGMLCLNEDAVYAINDLENPLCATIPNNSVVEKDQMVAATKVVPLVVKEEDVAAVEDICAGAEDVVSVKPFVSKKVGCVITGSEVFSKRVDDAFGPVLRAKVSEYGGEIIGMDFAPDDLDQIKDKILEMRDKGAEVIVATGGMSVDPDDKTPGAIRATGARIVKQGSPVLPGAMFLVAYLDDIPVLGVPAAGMYFKNTMFDRMLPYVFADVEIKREDIVKMGVGGLIMNNERYEIKK
ncbi:MAG: molybdopterin-binding protein [Anaerovoracaceae bacterium]|nr:molybdopterin-binding protein [Bacillota bacterium]MDY2670368.1 molybdopterin-binding protein [Anaerovoracaceae bacterium]